MVELPAKTDDLQGVLEMETCATSHLDTTGSLDGEYATQQY